MKGITISLSTPQKFPFSVVMMFCYQVLLLSAVFSLSSAYTNTTFIGAVFDQSPPISDPLPNDPITRDEALVIINRELDIYDEQCSQAKEQVRP